MMKETPIKEVLKPADAAFALGVGTCRVYQMIRAGELPAIKVGKRGVRIPRAAFEEHLERMNAEARASASVENFTQAFRQALQSSGAAVMDLLTPSADTLNQESGFQIGIRNMIVGSDNATARRIDRLAALANLPDGTHCVTL